ncbi:MAG: Ig-like domain-containing protein [Treponema sp.]|nr:Ig-like domain-containing protein [Treponema sp.]
MLFNFIKKSLVVIWVLTLVSCSDYFFKDFNVENSFLLDGKVYANFSAAIDANSARQFFLFSKNASPVEGKLITQEKQIIFEPLEKIEGNSSYKIQVFAGAKDIMGNTLQFDYCNEIIFKNDLTCPFVQGIDFSNNLIKISFNKKINKQSFNDCFSIIPQKDFACDWNDDQKNLLVLLKEKNPRNKKFSITIQKGLKDLDNNEMQNDFYWNWHPENNVEDSNIEFLGKECGKENFHAIKDIFENADLSEGLLLRFNNEINSETLESCIETEPRLSILVEAELPSEGKHCKNAKIKFLEYPKWNEEFELHVRNGIQDINENYVPQRTIKIKNNSKEREPPLIEFMAMKINGDWVTVDKNENWKNISFPLIEYPEGVEKKLPLRFVFSISKCSSQIDKISAMEALSIQGNSSANINIVSINSKAENDFIPNEDFILKPSIAEKISQLKSDGKKLSLIECDSIFKNRLQNEKPAYGIIEVKISKALKDNKGNFMEEEKLFSFNKN